MQIEKTTHCKQTDNMLFVINMSSICLIYTLFNFKLEFSFDDIYKHLFSNGIYTKTELGTI